MHCPRPPDPPQGPCPGGPAGGDFPIGDRGLLPVNEDRCETYIYNIHIYIYNNNISIYHIYKMHNIYIYIYIYIPYIKYT